MGKNNAVIPNQDKPVGVKRKSWLAGEKTRPFITKARKYENTKIFMVFFVFFRFILYG
jgi:hypothetical protein